MEARIQAAEEELEMPVVLEEFGSKLDKRCGRRPPSSCCGCASSLPVVAVPCLLRQYLRLYAECFGRSVVHSTA